jgi:hypothetical protein
MNTWSTRRICKVKGKKQTKRQTEKDRTTQKTYDDYEWEKQVEPKGIGKLLYVGELDKYLNYHKLNRKGKKPDKLFKTIALNK